MSQPAPAHADHPDFDAILRERFGFRGFRPGQREAIETLFVGRRLVCIQPTGHGKSLLYQVPSVALDGLTLVVSPLLALMRDQVRQLRERFGIEAGSINSDQSDDENDAVRSAVREGRLRILFVAPEQLDQLATFEFIIGLPVDLFVVDEAHCISTWGHDFRPSYRQIVNAIRTLEERRPGLRVLGLTATANARTELDILDQFRSRDGSAPAVQRQTMDRPNLVLRVIETRGVDAKLARLVELLESGELEEDACGLLYCATREQTEIVAGYLASRGHDVVAYHAGLAPDLKRHLQERFTDGGQRIIAATNALGMGIDKPDIRFIVHVDVPGSITAYYQEVGRAGRDGAPAEGILFFDARDRDVQDYFIRSAQPSIEDFEAVMSAVPRIGAGERPGRTELGSRTGMHPTLLIVVLAELVEQGFVVKDLEGRRQVYGRADRSDLPDLGRYARQLEVRTEELEAMLEYGRSTSTCHMERLRRALGDEGASPCGRCGGCLDLAAEPLPESELAAARGWVARREVPIPATRAPRMDAGIALLDGQIRSPLFVRFMRSRAEDPVPPGELLELFDDAVGRLGELHAFGSALIVPSRTWRQRAAIADRVDRVLRVPVFDDLLRWDPEPEARQGELLNNDQRRDNVRERMQLSRLKIPAGAVLIIDDYFGSGATIKEAVRAIRKKAKFKDPIVPLTLAKVRWRMGTPGML